MTTATRIVYCRPCGLGVTTNRPVDPTGAERQRRYRQRNPAAYAVAHAERQREYRRRQREADSLPPLTEEETAALVRTCPSRTRQ